MKHGFWFGMLSVAGCALLGGCMGPAPLPIAHWAAVDAKDAAILVDASGHGRTAELAGDAKTGGGERGNALVFSGAKDGLAAFDAPKGTAVTLTAWVKVAGMGEGDKPYPRVVEFPGCFLHVTSKAAGRLGLVFGSGGGHWSSAERSFVPDVWAHVAVTYDGSAVDNKPTFYVNGKPDPYAGGRQPKSALNLPGGKGTIGNSGARNRPFHGLMGDVRIYDTVLPARQVKALARRAPDGTAVRDVPVVYQDELPIVDITGRSRDQVVIAAGTPEIYQGHATTLLMPDQRTMFAVWSYEHGGACGPMARSDDAGLTWTRLDDTLPVGYAKHRNCPSLYRIVDGEGKERLWVFSGSRGMQRLLSEDGGKTWITMPAPGFPCGMPFTGMIRLQDGRTAAFGQRRTQGREQGVVMSTTADGGLTWTPLRFIAQQAGKNLCEPFALRSPDGKELCVLIRENFHTARSMMCFSRDEGLTWTAPEDTSWGLTGDRHEGVQAPDGRWVIAFRDRALNSSTYGQFMAWVGTYDDIRHAKPGQFRIHLLQHCGTARDGYSWANADTGYPGMELLPDGTIVATTYLKYWEDERRHSVVSARFKLDKLRIPRSARR